MAEETRQDILRRRIEANELHKQLTKWIEQEKSVGRMTEGDELSNASVRMLCSLWCAANNDKPPPTFKEDAERFDRVRREHTNP